MTRIADIGAAVIGTGFIGTVHVEALRRIGVQVRGVLGSTPERGAARADGARRRRAPTPPSTTCSPTRRVDVVHVTSPNHLHVPQAPAILAAGKHVVCEKPLAMTARGVRRAGRAGAPRAASSTPSTSTSASTRSTSTRARSSPPASSAMSGSSPAATSRTGCSSTPTGTGGSSRTGAARSGRSATSARTGWT